MPDQPNSYSQKSDGQMSQPPRDFILCTSQLGFRPDSPKPLTLIAPQDIYINPPHPDRYPRPAFAAGLEERTTRPIWRPQTPSNGTPRKSGTLFTHTPSEQSYF